MSEFRTCSQNDVVNSCLSPFSTELELGYWLVPAAWGKGYATEAGEAARDFAWEVVHAKSLVSYIAPENEASQRVAERLGASLEESLELLTHGQHCVYRYPPPGG